MLPKEHPDALRYNVGPDDFVSALFLKVKAEYASPYADAHADLETAWLRLREALLAGHTEKELVERARWVYQNTEQTFRPACARFIRDRYWIKKFESLIALRPVLAAGPYEGPLPQHP